MKRFSVKKLVASVSLLMVSLFLSANVYAASCKHNTVVDGKCMNCSKGIVFYEAKSQIKIGWGYFGQGVNYESTYTVKGTRHAWVFNKPITEIPDGLFNESKYLYGIEIPNSVTKLGKAFNKCENLQSVSIPGSVATIQEGTFNGCGKLSNVEIGEGVKNIGNGAFNGCNSIESIVLPSTIQNIGEGALGHCENLKDVTLSSCPTVGNDGLPNYKTQSGSSSNVVLDATLKIDDSFDLSSIKNEGQKYSSIVYSRAMSTKWGTLCLPFACEPDNGHKFYVLSQVEWNGVMVFSELDGVEAGQPCLIYKLDDNEEKVSVSASNAKISLNETSEYTVASSSSWVMKGTYEKVFIDAVAMREKGFEYYCMSKDNLVHALNTMTINAYRAYFECDTKNAPAAAPSRFSIEIAESNETGLDSVSEAQEEGVLYDLAGNRVENMVNGQVYILNGKKVMFK